MWLNVLGKMIIVRSAVIIHFSLISRVFDKYSKESISSATSLHLESSPNFLCIYSNNDKDGSWIIYKKKTKKKRGSSLTRCIR